MPPKKKSSHSAKDVPSKDQALIKQPPPNWPPFHPLVPPSDLSLHTLLPSQIITIPNFWPAKLCSTYVSFLSTLPLTTTPGIPKKGNAVRVNDRFQIEDPVFAQRLWNDTALKELICGATEEESVDGQPVGDVAEDKNGGMSAVERKELWGGDVVGLNPNIRIYRYRKGQFFDQHYDDSNNIILPGSPPIQAKTTWTLLIYLTSPATGCIGGETVFYPEPEPGKKKSKTAAPEPVVVELAVGMALLHRHGVDCMLHEGREVLEGEKWVVRSDLCVRR